jgi:hypothetical protein
MEGGKEKPRVANPDLFCPCSKVQPLLVGVAPHYSFSSVMIMILTAELCARLDELKVNLLEIMQDNISALVL